MSKFNEMLSINVNNHTEKKGRFTYLSWPFAVSELRKADPKATWETIKFDDKPFCMTDCGCFVEVAVTVDGVTLSQIHPVLDNSNKPIAKPNAFQINTSIQRCLVKAIALHGLGLYIYAGEDLPEATEEKKDTQKHVRKLITKQEALTLLKGAMSMDDLRSIWKSYGKQFEAELSLDEFAAVELEKDAKKAEFEAAANG